MILVDASIWIDHLRRGVRTLGALLESGRVLGHPFVIGELALGNLPRREYFLGRLRRLPRAEAATDDEAVALIDRYTLSGLGIGYVDLHLIASTLLTPDASLWTRDRRLGQVVNNLGLGPLSLPAV